MAGYFVPKGLDLKIKFFGYRYFVPMGQYYPV